jgi:hypothetical protein
LLDMAGMSLSATSKISLMASTFLAAVGCAMPAPIVRLEPRTPGNVVWVAGRAVQAKERAGVRVAAAFERQRGNGLGIRVEIENDTGASIDVSPDDVTFMTCATRDNASCVGSWGVVDPEQVLAGLDEQQSRSAAEASNSQGMYTTLVFLSVIGDAAQIASGHANSTTGLDTVAAADAADAAGARADGVQMSIEGQRELWSNAALRRNTLEPGRGTSGLVFVPVDLKTHYLWIHVRAGGQIFAFGFQQSVRSVAANKSRA